MTEGLDKKETYLYGTFLALVQEQLNAVDKHVSGKLGFWGKGRMQARNVEMQKFLKKIVEHKISKGSQDPLNEIIHDLEFIEHDTQAWGDISKSQLDYVRNVLSVL